MQISKCDVSHATVIPEQQLPHPSSGQFFYDGSNEDPHVRADKFRSCRLVHTSPQTPHTERICYISDLGRMNVGSDTRHDWLFAADTVGLNRGAPALSSRSVCAADIFFLNPAKFQRPHHLNVPLFSCSNLHRTHPASASSRPYYQDE